MQSGSFFHSLSHPSVHWRWGPLARTCSKTQRPNKRRQDTRQNFLSQILHWQRRSEFRTPFGGCAEAIVFVLARLRNVVIRDPIVLPACAGLIAGTSWQAHYSPRTLLSSMNLHACTEERLRRESASQPEDKVERVRCASRNRKDHSVIPGIHSPKARIFLASFLVLFLEIALIRWMPAYIRLLAYFSSWPASSESGWDAY